MIHQRTHPGLDVEGCFGCKISGVTFGSVPGGTRSGSAGRKAYETLKRDIEAYEGARKAGLRPDASTKAAVEKAERKAEVEERALKKLDYNRKSDFLSDLKPLKRKHGAK